MWAINTTDRFDRWFTSLDDTERASVLAALLVLREKGPGLSRPYADTLKGSRHSNMKVRVRAIPCGRFSPLIQTARVSCFVRAIRSAMKGDSTMRCFSLLTGNSLTG